MYGANIPGFTFVDMLARLRADGLLPYRIAAVAPGGEHDGGTRRALRRRRARRSSTKRGAAGCRWSRARRSPTASSGGSGSTTRRPAAGRSAASSTSAAASANFGDTAASLDVPNGLVLKLPALPSSPTRGLVFEFAARGIPVVHLLHVKGLARDNGLPFDPVPFPPPSDEPSHRAVD